MQVHTGILLGSAAFCSGTAWQPALNFAHNTLNLDFNHSMALTGALCGAAFFGGLRIGRALYSPLLAGVDKPTYSNLKADVGLSAAVGGASSGFVGTDISFGDANWLTSLVGVTPQQTNVMACTLAGASTALGFSVLQSLQNLLLRKGKNWVD